ncbi:oxygenase MpaB family protein [Actinokineospora spheciospongiae]|uniref:oxygenase MpaB family protein n=1 Tax=Actinokineospora spheciospongiae TaxID=909613 RepID=UPI000D7151B5|nr:oxygenase MpaB family protein [Actinokineospora spheciospongiae]PWW65913.1 uncharacterized protein DUF2236 [Actinokineospora spheciospongiae]
MAAPVGHGELRLRLTYGGARAHAESTRLHTLHREWRHLGRILGIPDHTMPRDHKDFRAYVEEKTATLTANHPIQDVLHSLIGAVPPPTKWFPKPLWHHLPTRPSVNWSTMDDCRFARQSDRIRRTVSALPAWASQYPAATSAYASAR